MRRLTAHQARVFTYMANGYNNAEIAVEMKCSPNTVESVIRAGLRHLGGRSRVHGIAIAVRLNEVNPDDVEIPDPPKRTVERTHRALTDRQVEVLTAARDHGGTLVELGAVLSMEKGRIGSILCDIYERLRITHIPKAERRAAAIALAEHMGLLPPRKEEES